MTFLLVNTAQAATVEVEWKNPDDYRDIISGNIQSKSNFRKSLFRTMAATFAKHAVNLPPDYNLKVVMIDIDLAGKVQLGRNIEIREINDHDFPRIKFNIVLTDKNDNIILQGVQNLKEQKYKHNSFRMKGSQSSFYLETDLINKWFTAHLIPAVNGPVKS